jgi:hypothetical protein
MLALFPDALNRGYAVYQAVLNENNDSSAVFACRLVLEEPNVHRDSASALFPARAKAGLSSGMFALPQ